MFSYIPDHVAQALKRRITQYVNSPNLAGLIVAVSQQVQVVEDQLVLMNTLRYIDMAFGQQLDNIGKIVGISRPAGLGDDQYRQLILGQIKINTSDGQPEQLIQLYSLLVSPVLVILYESDLASVILESDYQIPDQATADHLISIIRQAAPAGVRIDGLVSFDPSDAFAYDGALPGVGYGTVSNPTTGGKYPFYWTFTGGGFAYAGSDASGLGYGSIKDPLAGGKYLT